MGRGAGDGATCRAASITLVAGGAASTGLLLLVPGVRQWLLSNAFGALQNLRVLPRIKAEGHYSRDAATLSGSNDAESGYGGPASEALVRLGNLERLRPGSTIVEFGCGRGRLAWRLLKHALPRNARYIGIDQSAAMLDRARESLVEFADRVHLLHLPGGDPAQALGLLEAAGVRTGSVDCFLSTYVLDLLDDDDSGSVLKLAKMLLREGGEGVLCLSGITYGDWRMPITVYWTLRWEARRLWRPTLVGGCRPQEMEPLLERHGWHVHRREVVFPTARPWMCSEVLVCHAERAA